MKEFFFKKILIDLTVSRLNNSDTDKNFTDSEDLLDEIFKKDFSQCEALINELDRGVRIDRKIASTSNMLVIICLTVDTYVVPTYFSNKTDEQVAETVKNMFQRDNSNTKLLKRGFTRRFLNAFRDNVIWAASFIIEEHIARYFGYPEIVPSLLGYNVFIITATFMRAILNTNVFKEEKKGEEKGYWDLGLFMPLPKANMVCKISFIISQFLVNFKSDIYETWLKNRDFQANRFYDHTSYVVKG